MQAAYDDWLSRVLPVAESRSLPTTFGTAHVLSFGSTRGRRDAAALLGPVLDTASSERDDSPPVIALPGTNFPALAWSPLLPVAGVQCHAVDLIGQPGRTTGPRLSPSGQATVQWLDDVLDGLAAAKAVE